MTEILTRVYPEFEEKPKPTHVTLLAPSRAGSDELHTTFIRALDDENILHETNEFYDPSKKTDRVVIIGPMDHYREQIRSLVGDVPPISFWFTEQVPDPSLPPSAVKLFSKVRYNFDRKPAWQSLPGNRWRRAGELTELKKTSADITVHTFSNTNTQFFKNLGMAAKTTPWGYYEELGKLEKPQNEREIDVIFMGNLRNPRGKIIQTLEEQLKSMGIHMEVHAPERGNEIYGPERTNKLNAAKIMLAYPMRPWDDIHFRMLLAGANGVAVVSPLLNPASIGPFTQDQDFMMVNDTSLAPQIAKLLKDGDLRNNMAQSLHEKVIGMPQSQQVKSFLGF